jgi:hypothetical protein
LAKAIRKNKSLKKINLAHNSIGDAGVIHLAAAIPSHRKLRELNLTSNQITDEGAIAFAQVGAITLASVNRVCFCQSFRALPLLPILSIDSFLRSLSLSGIARFAVRPRRRRAQIPHH